MSRSLRPVQYELTREDLLSISFSGIHHEVDFRDCSGVVLGLDDFEVSRPLRPV